jgi:hypothetical protein
MRIPKLASPTGTLLGSVTFPDLWLSYLNVLGVVEFSTIGYLGAVFRDHGVTGTVVLARGVSSRSRSASARTKRRPTLPLAMILALQAIERVARSL